MKNFYSYAVDPLFTIRIHPAEDASPIGKLADVELVFTAAAGPLSGLRLVNFAVWQRRALDAANARAVTFPARAYSVNGERRVYTLLRPNDGAASATLNDRTSAEAPLRALILEAYAAYEAHEAMDPDAPPVPAGLRIRKGVEYGCGRIGCRDCYEPIGQ